MKSKIKIGVIGVGHLGKHHVNHFSKIEDAKLLGVYDINQKTSEKISRRYNITPFESLSELIEKEIEIAKDQLRAEGKPEAMLDNIAKGKLKRFFKDNTLLNQAFIKDTKISVSNYLSSFDENLTVTSYERVSIG